MRIAVAIEATPKKSFATAVDWPGWSRSAKTEDLAVEALAAYADRYRPVAALAGEKLPAKALEFEVVERTSGGGATAYGVPSNVTDQDRRPIDAAAADRLAKLVDAAWRTFDGVSAKAPEELRNGPRGGGRDTSKIIEHVEGADGGYAREMGIRLTGPIDQIREAILEVLREPSDGSPIGGRRWTTRYAAHRVAWHALDHAWEIEDRTEPASRLIRVVSSRGARRREPGPGPRAPSSPR